MMEELQLVLNLQKDTEQHSIEVLAELKALSDEKDEMHRKVRLVVEWRLLYGRQT